MTMRLLAASSPGEIRVAVVGERLVDYAIWRPGAPDGVGDLHGGRVIARVRSMAGSFVALVDAEGFLPDSESGAGPSEGTGLSEGGLLTVRITRAAQGGKGPRLSAQVEQVAGAVGLVRRGPNPLELLAALHPAAGVYVDDPGLAAGLRGVLGDRLRLVARAFAAATEDAVAALADETVALPGGGRMTIQPTAALVAIDIDSGRATGTNRLAFNQAAIPELARQIRVRNLGGAVLVDFAGLAARGRAHLGPMLSAALAADPVATRLLGFTGLGLAEIVRNRVHPPLHERLAGPHAALLAALRAAVAGTTPGAALVLRAAPGLVAALDRDARARAELAQSPAHGLVVVRDSTLGELGWSLSA